MKNIRDYFKSIWFSLGYSFRFVPKTTTAMAVLYALGGLVPYATAYLLGRLVDVIVTGVSVGMSAEIWQAIALYSFFAIIPALLGNIQLYVNRQRMLTLQMETDLDLMRHRERIDIARYESPNFQDLVQRTFRNGPNPIHQLSNTQFDLIAAAVSFIAGTILSVSFDFWVYFWVIVTSVPAFIADIKYAGQSWSIWAKDSPEQRRLADLRGHITGGRTLLIETKLLQSGEKIFSWIRKIFVDFAEKQRGLEKVRLWQTSAGDIVTFIGVGFGLYLVVQNVVEGGEPIGTLVYMIGTLASVRSSIARFLENISGQYENHLMVKDLIEFINTEPIIKDAENPIALDLTAPPEITFDNVSFRYPNSEKWSLRKVSLVLKPGDKVGLVGNNGAGKTTFVKLLCRIYDPTEGRILVNGTDLKDVSIKEWWSYLGVMFQDYASYDFKVKEAIAIGRPDKPLDFVKVRNAADISQSSGFIEAWKDKYEEQIGVVFKGVEPSKGQRQKLSIAKVVYRSAYLMILDEPTASVDAESEARIFDSLEHLSKDMTAILISHDFSTISECDQIFVLEEAKLIESGDHKTLMKEKGKYAELYKLQAERFKK